jgi:hypothetical protein
MIERLFSAVALDVHLEDQGVLDEAADGGKRHRLMGKLRPIRRTVDWK